MELNFAERLEEVCDRLYNGNKADMAREMGKKPSSVYQYFNGTRNPGNEILHQLTNLGVNLNWLFTGHGQMLTSDALQVNDDGLTYNPSDPIDLSLMTIRTMLKDSSIPGERQEELVTEWRKTVALEQNQALYEKLGKK
jgi:transcriptional regulator with XRE-family HTH domain